MEDGVLGILGFMVAFVVLDVVALRFGRDSRSMAREMPLLGDGVLRIPPRSGHRPRALLTSDVDRDHTRRARPAPSWSSTIVAHAQRCDKPFQPYITGEVYAYPRFDLATIGK